MNTITEVTLTGPTPVSGVGVIDVCTLTSGAACCGKCAEAKAGVAHTPCAGGKASVLSGRASLGITDRSAEKQLPASWQPRTVAAPPVRGMVRPSTPPPSGCASPCTQKWDAAGYSITTCDGGPNAGAPCAGACCDFPPTGGPGSNCFSSKDCRCGLYCNWVDNKCTYGERRNKWCLGPNDCGCDGSVCAERQPGQSTRYCRMPECVPPAKPSPNGDGSCQVPPLDPFSRDRACGEGEEPCGLGCVPKCPPYFRRNSLTCECEPPFRPSPDQPELPKGGCQRGYFLSVSGKRRCVPICQHHNPGLCDSSYPPEKMEEKCREQWKHLGGRDTQDRQFFDAKCINGDIVCTFCRMGNI